MRVAPGAIQMLEEAVHLLRRAPRTALVCHLLGATPFALALLLFWNDVNNPHTSDATVGRESVVLALLLVWMSCWRAVFAGRLRRQLSASPDTPWTWRRTWNLVAGQAFLGATKLVVLPLALLTLFGFSWTVAFYRSATALADRADLDPLQLIARARRLAGFDRRQSWLLVPIIGFLWLLVTANLGLALALLPQLIHTLTGYESQFSRSGGYYIFTPLFLWATLAISWMIFDPFIQAVYCLRGFYAESVTTGEISARACVCSPRRPRFYWCSCPFTPSPTCLRKNCKTQSVKPCSHRSTIGVCPHGPTRRRRAFPGWCA